VDIVLPEPYTCPSAISCFGTATGPLRLSDLGLFFFWPVAYAPFGSRPGSLSFSDTSLFHFFRDGVRFPPNLSGTWPGPPVLTPGRGTPCLREVSFGFDSSFQQLRLFVVFSSPLNGCYDFSFNGFTSYTFPLISVFLDKFICLLPPVDLPSEHSHIISLHTKLPSPNLATVVGDHRPIQLSTSRFRPGPLHFLPVFPPPPPSPVVKRQLPSNPRAPSPTVARLQCDPTRPLPGPLESPPLPRSKSPP